MDPRKLVALAAALALAGAAHAEDVRRKPFVLASRGPGEVESIAAEAKAKLAGAGFTVLGDYTPYPGAWVAAITSDELLAAAGSERNAGYGAVQRVSVTKVGEEIQVAYTNPVYMAEAYRMKADLAPVAAKLEKALGRTEEFGPPAGLTDKALRKYHYMMGMP